MHLNLSATTVLLALSSSAPTMAGRSWFCPLSLDAKMIQDPYCCEGFVEAADSKVSMEGVNCVDVSKVEKFPETCPEGGMPKCCYKVGLAVICTTEVGKGVDE